MTHAEQQIWLDNPRGTKACIPRGGPGGKEGYFRWQNPALPLVPPTSGNLSGESCLAHLCSRDAVLCDPTGIGSACEDSSTQLSASTTRHKASMRIQKELFEHVFDTNTMRLTARSHSIAAPDRCARLLCGH